MRKGSTMNTEVSEQHAGEQGISLIETMLATLLTVVGLSAVLGLFAVGMVQSQTQGDVSSRATTFSQAKMEELSALPFNDAATNTTVSPWTATGGTGLCGILGANASCGGVTPGVPVNSYVDYLAFDGTRVTATAVDANGVLRQNFMRQWVIQADASTNLKTITVRTTATRTLGRGVAPFTVLSSLKSRPVT